MRVYCKNCKYYGYREFASLGVNWSYFCKLKIKSWIDKEGRKVVYYKDSDIEEGTLNNNFNCENYKRKWWKFWIRGG